MLERVLIVGASLAGLRAAEALRREGYAGKLALIGAEPHLPYDRPPLSKQLLRGEWSPERIALRKDGYDALELELHLGVRATKLDAAQRRVTLEDGRELGYDGLVLATGAVPRELPGMHALSGVHVLRTLDDALALRKRFAEQPRVCLVGAGFIGLEVAASCRKLGLAVTAVEPLPVPLSNKLGERMARVLEALHRDQGVALRCGLSVSGFEGQGRVERVRLSDGSAVEADLVIVGVGVIPAVQWLEGSGLDLSNGIACNETCATPLPGVVAAGDAARWYNPVFGQSMRVEHWSNAGDMADHAARRLLGGPGFKEAYAPVPYFWTDQYDIKLQFAGDCRPDDELAVVEGSEQERRFVALYGRKGRVTAVLGIGRPAQVARYRRAIADGLTWESALADARRS